MDEDNILAAIGSTEASTFGEFCSAFISILIYWF